MARRADYGTRADAFFDGLDQPVNDLACAVRSAVQEAVPELSECIKWGMPVYEIDGRMVCSIRCTKSYAALQLLIEDVVLDDPGGLLDGTGRTMRHVKIRELADARRPELAMWLRKIAAGK
ncbi:MAG: hypothetical protein RLZ98_2567 [Pseudomonadota bacterium]|jgi:hypothetical protein